MEKSVLNKWSRVTGMCTCGRIKPALQIIWYQYRLKMDGNLHVRPETLAMVGRNTSNALWHRGLFEEDSRNSENDLQNSQTGFHKTKILLHSKGNSLQSKA